MSTDDRLVFLRASGLGRMLGAFALAWVCLHAGAGPAGIYTCVDAQGRRHTSDRPIPECLDREQRVLNRDGSQRQVVPPRMTAEQRAAAEERRRQLERQEAARKDAIRRDRNLLHRFPDEPTHAKARSNALEVVRRVIQGAERQLVELDAERQRLDAEAEFYEGRRLPPRLRSQVDANDAQRQAQRDVIQTQRGELDRINALYDVELERLRRLWAGQPAGFDAAP